MLLWEFAPSRIAGECAKPLSGFRFEDENAHVFDPFCARGCTLMRPSCSGAHGPAPGSSHRLAHPKDQSSLLQIVWGYLVIHPIAGQVSFIVAVYAMIS